MIGVADLECHIPVIEVLVLPPQSEFRTDSGLYDIVLDLDDRRSLDTHTFTHPDSM